MLTFCLIRLSQKEWLIRFILPQPPPKRDFLPVLRKSCLNKKLLANPQYPVGNYLFSGAFVKQGNINFAFDAVAQAADIFAVGIDY